MKNILCYDIGGTYTKYGVINEIGELVYHNKVKTSKENCDKTILEMLMKIYHEVCKSYSINQVGISTAGKVDCGKILPNYTGTDIKRYIESQTGLNCKVENDGHCAALGEMWKGIAKDCTNFVTLTYGTGIGGAFIVNGEIYKGTNFGAMGVGHIIINSDGEKCSCDCNMNGVYENYASTSSLLKEFNISGEEFVEKLKKDNKHIKLAYMKFIKNVSIGIVNVVHILDPDLIVIGGGLMEQEFIVDDIRNEVRNKVLQFYNDVKIEKALLGNMAGLYGAAYTCLTNNFN